MEGWVGFGWTELGWVGLLYVICMCRSTECLTSCVHGADLKHHHLLKCCLSKLPPPGPTIHNPSVAQAALTEPVYFHRTKWNHWRECDLLFFLFFLFLFLVNF